VASARGLAFSGWASAGTPPCFDAWSVGLDGCIQALLSRNFGGAIKRSTRRGNGLPASGSIIPGSMNEERDS